MSDSHSATDPRDDVQGIEVTIRDLSNGDTETKVIWNDYLVICAGNRYLDGVTAHATGTHVLVVKKEARDATK